MGGTPLNNEVWQLVDIQKINRTEPLTRSQFVPYTYNLTWKQMPHAPWSPRVGASLVSQWYFNTSQGETIDNSRERLVLIGGYGGFVESDSRYDGYYSRADTWSFDGADWTVLKAVNTFGGRAWMGAVVRHLTNPRDDVFGRANPPRIFIFGGGNTGKIIYS